MPRSAVTKASVNDIKALQRDFERSQWAGKAFEDERDTESSGWSWTRAVGSEGTGRRIRPFGPLADHGELNR